MIFVVGVEALWAKEDSYHSKDFHRFWQDWMDDGNANGSVKISEKNSELSEPGKYPAHRLDTFYNGQLSYSQINVDKLMTSWSGGPDHAGDYSDPKGPNITPVLWNFLKQFSL